MKRICLPVFAVLPLCAFAATRFTPPQVPPSEWADTEARAAIPFGVAPTFFDPAWNRARVTVRGRDAASESIDGRLASQGFAVRVR